MESVRAQWCCGCDAPVTMMRTYTNTRMGFDSDIVPRHLDRSNSGWMPGRWTIRGRDYIAMAPLALYPAEKIARATSVMFPHRCPRPSMSRNHSVRHLRVVR